MAVHYFDLPPPSIHLPLPDPNQIVLLNLLSPRPWFVTLIPPLAQASGDLRPVNMRTSAVAAICLAALVLGSACEVGQIHLLTISTHTSAALYTK